MPKKRAAKRSAKKGKRAVKAKPRRVSSRISRPEPLSDFRSSYQSRYYRKRRFDPLLIAIVAVFIIVIVLGAMVFARNPPDISLNFGAKKTIDIEDQCSQFYNNLVHTVNNEAECQVQCYTRCQALDMSLDDFQFTQQLTRCHDCTCECS